MRKTMLFIAALAIMAAPTAALAKHTKKHRSAPVAAAPADPNENGRRLVWNGIGLIFLPFNSFWVVSAAPVVAKY